MFDIVVVGADQSVVARHAVEHAAELVRATGGTLHIVGAYKPHPASLEDLPDEFRYTMSSPGSADELLAELANVVLSRGVEAVTHAVDAGPAEALVRVAHQEGADLIVVGNKSSHAGRRALGSVPNAVANDAPCAVLILPGDE